VTCDDEVHVEIVRFGRKFRKNLAGEGDPDAKGTGEVGQGAVVETSSLPET